MAIGMKRTYPKKTTTMTRRMGSGSGYARPLRQVGTTRSFALRAPMSTRGWRPFTTTNQELKVQDTAPATYQINTTGSITLLAIPITGADYNARIGRKIKLKSIYIRGFGFQESVSTTIISTPNQCRFMLVYDLQPNGAAPSITDILNTADSTAQLNLNNRDRFRIISDRIFMLDALSYNNTATQSAALGSGRSSFNLRHYQRLNLEMIFNGVNGGTVADIASGALYMVWIGSRNSGTIDGNFYGSARVRYSDI